MFGQIWKQKKAGGIEGGRREGAKEEGGGRKILHLKREAGRED